MAGKLLQNFNSAGIKLFFQILGVGDGLSVCVCARARACVCVCVIL